jgi:hypothetical protein
MAARLYNAKNECVHTISGGFIGEKVRYQNVIYHAAGWVVPSEDRAG